MYVAIRIDVDLDTTINRIRKMDGSNHFDYDHGIYASDDATSTKNYVSSRIMKFPQERWMILFGQTLAQITTHVTFQDI